MKDPLKVIEEMAATYAERRSVYKDNWLKIGEVLAAIYPSGLYLTGADAFNRFQLFVHFVTRMTRLAESDLKHVDSSLDLAVYSAMLTAFNDKSDDAKKPNCLESCYHISASSHGAVLHASACPNNKLAGVKP